MLVLNCFMIIINIIHDQVQKCFDVILTCKFIIIIRYSQFINHDILTLSTSFIRNKNYIYIYYIDILTID